MLMMETASLGLSTQPDDVPSPLTECLDILLYEASLPTGHVHCIITQNSDFFQISFLKKRQIKSNFQVS